MASDAMASKMTGNGTLKLGLLEDFMNLHPEVCIYTANLFEY